MTAVNPSEFNGLIGSGNHSKLHKDKSSFVGAANGEVIGVTYTSGSAPTPDNYLTIADSATPTNAELLEYCAELHYICNGLAEILIAHGLMTDDDSVVL